jgi:hypothetical protein
MNVPIVSPSISPSIASYVFFKSQPVSAIPDLYMDAAEAMRQVNTEHLLPLVDRCLA